jgi:hypothetical protein
MDVTVLLEPKIDLDRLAEVLDGLGHEGRVHATRTWSRAQKKGLYEAAKGFRPIDLDFVVPAGAGPLVEVIHQGHNTVPLFHLFQKRFVKLPNDDAIVWGYNHQSMNAFTGPGYFAVTKGAGDHEGELVIDYARTPKERPPGWPEIAPNDGLIPGIVYGGMTDYLRAISTHVSIGAAYKGNDARDQWFALVRKDPG